MGQTYWYRVSSADQQQFGKLQQAGVAIPPGLSSGRNATHADMQQALAEWRRRVSERIGAETEVLFPKRRSRWVVVTVEYMKCECRQGFDATFEFNDSKADDEEQPFLCHAGFPVPFLEVLHCLSQITGPLAVEPVLPPDEERAYGLRLLKAIFGPNYQEPPDKRSPFLLYADVKMQELDGRLPW
jgi:hypothetical protein